MKRWEIWLPNGNDLLLALQKHPYGKAIRRKCTALAEFVDHGTWFSWPLEKRRKYIRGTLSTSRGLYLSKAEVWVKFRANPSGDLEMNAGQGWVQFQWGLESFVVEMTI
jgi:hypothetical protein